ncbi:MAG: hypothetical protein LKK08_05710 [Bacteroidales bacterium]|nr:hypothetical protein [Bacteroidales bacterium]MCI2145725.1 hypothetical protein [Bacteroidales bacterium]
MAKSNNNIEMRLLSVNEEKFMMAANKCDGTTAPEDLQLEFSNRVSPNTETNIIDISFGVRYVLKEEPILESVYRFSFEVKNLSSFVVKNDDGNMTINDIMPHLLNVAVGTMRGILVVKTAGTNLSKYPLPIIDATTLSNNLSSKK